MRISDWSSYVCSSDLHALDAHDRAGARRMDKLAVAQVNAHMGEPVAPCIEEHQVAALQFISLDGDAFLSDFGRASRQFQTQRFFGGVNDQTAAIEACVGGFTAIAVFDAQHA